MTDTMPGLDDELNWVAGPDLRRALKFMRVLGMETEVVRHDHSDAFVPGVWLDHGRLVVFPEVAALGDVLHEAGHLAVIPSVLRALTVPGSLPGDALHSAAAEYLERSCIVDACGTEDPLMRGILQMGECEAIAWSYAAARALDFDPVILTAQREDGSYPFGEPDAGAQVLLRLNGSAHFGIHGLQAAGFCRAREFPLMLRWLAV